MASSVNEKFEDSNHLESYIMIWLDETSNQPETETIQKIQGEVRSIINCQKTFEDLDKCRHFIEETKDTRLVIASNERLGKQLIPVVDHWQNISAVYIYYTDDRSGEEQSKMPPNVSKRDRSTDIEKHFFEFFITELQLSCRFRER
jgi:hypothetical protein